MVAMGLWLLKGANDDFALGVGALPPGVDTSGVIATPTADPGLPGADQGVQAEPPCRQQPGGPATVHIAGRPEQPEWTG